MQMLQLICLNNNYNKISNLKKSKNAKQNVIIRNNLFYKEQCFSDRSSNPNTNDVKSSQVLSLLKRRKLRPGR